MNGNLATYTLWTLVEALTAAGTTGGLQAIEQTVVGPLAIANETEFAVFYTGRNPGLSDHSEITNIRVILNKAKGLGAIVMDISGSCVTVTDIQKYFSDAYLADPPRSPAPLAKTYWATRELKVPVLFGFTNVAPDCLARIVIDFRRNLDTYDPYPEKRGT